jgi:hypothetical protein
LYFFYLIDKTVFQHWELLVLEKLGWELSAVVPLDYVDQVTDKLGLNPELNLAPVKHQSEIVLIQACTQSQFTYTNPSVLVIDFQHYVSFKY